MQTDRFARQNEEVLDRASSLVRRYAGNIHQGELLDAALIDFRDNLARHAPYGPVCMPLAVFRSLGGKHETALTVAVALGLLNLGTHLTDDIADGGLAPHWDGYRPSEIGLLATTLCAALPQAIIGDLDLPPPRREAALRTIANALLRMAAGQQSDLALARSPDITVADAEAIAAKKTGEETVLCVVPAAILAGADPESVERYEALARAIGTGGGIASDCYDLFTASRSDDLANGVRTLPVLLHLEALPAGERAAFIVRLDQARRDEGAQATVRRELVASGALRHCAILIEVYRRRAMDMLAEIAPPEPALSVLRDKIDEMSFFAAKPQAAESLSASA